MVVAGGWVLLARSGRLRVERAVRLGHRGPRLLLLLLLRLAQAQLPRVGVVRAPHRRLLARKWLGVLGAEVGVPLAVGVDEQVV